MKMNTRKNIRGQGMSEYLIIVALIAVAGIAVMGLFGNAARDQVAGLANELGGGLKIDTYTSTGAALVAGQKAIADSKVETNLSNFGGNAATIAGTTGRKAAQDQ